MSELDISQVPFDATAAQLLVAAAQADLADRYGGSGDDNPVQAADFTPPHGCFLVARRHGVPVACAGWRTLHPYDDTQAQDPYAAEIKRMFAVAGVRGTGVAALLLDALADSARRHGMRRFVLETGPAQPEAIRFYEKHGFVRIANYGYYRHEPGCLSFARDL